MKVDVVVSPKVKKNIEQVCQNIRFARMRRKITSAILAERAGISRATLSRLESGDTNISFKSLCNVLFCLGMEDDLLKLASDDVLGRKLQDLETIRESNGLEVK